MNHNLFLDFHFWPPLLPYPSSIWLMNELLEPLGHPITLDEQDPGTTPVTESPSTSTRKSYLKKMYLIKKIFKNLIAFQKLKGKWNIPDDGEHVDKDESQNGRENDAGPAVSGHSADDVEQRLLAVNDVKKHDKCRRDFSRRQWALQSSGTRPNSIVRKMSDNFCPNNRFVQERTLLPFHW